MSTTPADPIAGEACLPHHDYVHTEEELGELCAQRYARVYVFQTGNARALFTLRERLISDRRLPGADVTRLCPTKLSPGFSRYFSYRARLSTSAASGVPRHHATSSRVERVGAPFAIDHVPQESRPTKERKTKTRITCTAATFRSTRPAHICI